MGKIIIILLLLFASNDAFGLSVYKYDKYNIYTSSSKARMVNGDYIFPARSTTIKPAGGKSGFINRFDGEKWVIERDLRGKIYYDNDGGRFVTGRDGKVPPLVEFDIPFYKKKEVEKQRVEAEREKEVMKAIKSLLGAKLLSINRKYDKIISDIDSSLTTDDLDKVRED